MWIKCEKNVATGIYSWNVSLRFFIKNGNYAHSSSMQVAMPSKIFMLARKNIATRCKCLYFVMDVFVHYHSICPSSSIKIYCLEGSTLKLMYKRLSNSGVDPCIKKILTEVKNFDRKKRKNDAKKGRKKD